MMGTDFNTTETKSTQPAEDPWTPEVKAVLCELAALIREDITREQAARKASG